MNSIAVALVFLAVGLQAQPSAPAYQNIGVSRPHRIVPGLELNLDGLKKSTPSSNSNIIDSKHMDIQLRDDYTTDDLIKLLEKIYHFVLRLTAKNLKHERDCHKDHDHKDGNEHDPAIELEHNYDNKKYSSIITKNMNDDIQKFADEFAADLRNTLRGKLRVKNLLKKYATSNIILDNCGEHIIGIDKTKKALNLLAMFMRFMGKAQIEVTNVSSSSFILQFSSTRISPRKYSFYIQKPAMKIEAVRAVNCKL
ncbi:unnamed protein product [Caenorhabditis bovis]|uniref:Uncharacterized protein n=1 Tax=Caenorhabditis bovis TaxID=2654633 RepID=A0A8S1E093_9PELO|nr:unnamed protein product [Caenorhabditis bovis]